MDEEEAYAHVRNTLKEERMMPFSTSEMEVVRSVGQCINCGTCLNHCPVTRAVGVERFTGPRGIAVELSRSPPEYWSSTDRIYLCTGCGTCREVCPKNVDIPNVVNLMRRRIFSQRPDLVPQSLHQQNEILRKHNLAFVPWDDPDEKAESRNMRLERLDLPFIKDKIRKGAEVLFYPGCQAEERAQEVREAAKIILERFNVDYTLVEKMTCCSLPAILVGDMEKSIELSTILKKQIDDLGVKKIVTTCAGCTSNLNEIAARNNWEIPVYHILEFLVEDIGVHEVSKALSPMDDHTVRVTVHDPCHLIRHTSRRVLEYAHRLLNAIPDVEVVESSAHDLCCGGGGLVGRHSPDVSRVIVKENIRAIKETSAERIVTPCPLCTAQIEESLFRDGSDIEVDDLTVFIAQSFEGG